MPNGSIMKDFMILRFHGCTSRNLQDSEVSELPMYGLQDSMIIVCIVRWSTSKHHSGSRDSQDSKTQPFHDLRTPRCHELQMR